MARRTLLTRYAYRLSGDAQLLVELAAQSGQKAPKEVGLALTVIQTWTDRLIAQNHAKPDDTPSATLDGVRRSLAVRSDQALQKFLMELDPLVLARLLTSAAQPMGHEPLR